RLHPLETERQRALGQAAPNRLRRKVERGGTGGAVVVDIDHRDTGHAQLVDRALAGGRLTVDVADVGLFHFAVVDSGIGEGLGARLARHIRVVPVAAVFVLAPAGLFELRHPDTDD